MEFNTRLYIRSCVHVYLNNTEIGESGQKIKISEGFDKYGGYNNESIERNLRCLRRKSCGELFQIPNFEKFKIHLIQSNPGSINRAKRKGNVS